MSGHIFDMVNRMKQNRIPKRNKFKGDNRELIYSDKSETEYDFPKISETEIKDIRLDLQLEQKTEKRRFIFYLFISLLVSGLLVWTIITFYDLNKYSLIK